MVLAPTADEHSSERSVANETSSIPPSVGLRPRLNGRRTQSCSFASSRREQRGLRDDDGYSIDQALKLRRPPFSAPALVNGKRPAARRATVTFHSQMSPGAPDQNVGAVLDLIYDEPVARMDYTLRIDPAGADRLTAVWIHAGTTENPGAARHQVSDQANQQREV